MTDRHALARRVADKMLRDDAFSRWLGIEVVESAPHRSVLRMTVRDEMVNGFGICHGGVTYALADSALAFACNSHGRVTVAIENSIGYPAPTRVGDVITATADAESVGRKIASYRITVTNQADASVAHFRGTVYDTGRPHFSDDATDGADASPGTD